MDHVKSKVECVQLPVSSQLTFPDGPYPRKYVHSVINELNYVVQAVHALRDAGYPDDHIHVMAGWDFVDAAERKNQGGCIAAAFRSFISFFDEGFGNTYLSEAQRGNHILAVRLSRKEQMKHVRDLLSAHFAHQIKYVDTWVVTDLLSTPEFIKTFN